MTQLMTPVQKSKARILLQHPFYGSMLLNGPIKEVPGCGTAFTDMVMIGYDPEFFDKLDVDEIIFVLVHEVLHKLFLHGLRRGNRHPRLWNMAADFAINWILVKEGFKAPDLAKIFGNPQMRMCFDPKYANMSAEHIYDLLRKEAGGGGSGGDPGDDPQGGFGGDLHEVPGEGDPSAMAEIERTIQQQVGQAATMARMAGKLPGSLEKAINDLLNPQLPWDQLLRDYMTRVIHDDESWAHRNRRFDDVYLPRRWSARMGEVIYIGDTSGSVTSDELNKGASEVVAIASVANPERIRMIWADTRVAREEVFESGDPIEFNVAGGGGTDMRVPLRHVEQYEPDVVILCTDGHTPWPDSEPPYPLIVLCTTDVPCPVGQVIRI